MSATALISFRPLPYTFQDGYECELKRELSLPVAVLENEHLRAKFLLTLGGRLRRLYDKDAKRELLTVNTELLPGNLGIRNAWFAGGVEYNIGKRGHDPQTCSPRFAARLVFTDGSPTLRIYEMSRDTLTPFQLDFILPHDSRLLYVRARIENPSDAAPARTQTVRVGAVPRRAPLTARAAGGRRAGLCRNPRRTRPDADGSGSDAAACGMGMDRGLWRGAAGAVRSVRRLEARGRGVRRGGGAAGVGCGAGTDAVRHARSGARVRRGGVRRVGIRRAGGTAPGLAARAATRFRDDRHGAARVARSVGDGRDGRHAAEILHGAGHMV